MKYKLLGGPGTCSPGEIWENLECLGMHFTQFSGGESELKIVKRRT